VNAPQVERRVDAGHAHPTFCHAYGTASLCDHHDGWPTLIGATAGLDWRNDEDRAARFEVSALKTERGRLGVNVVLTGGDGREAEGQLTPSEARELAVSLLQEAENAEREARR